MFGVNRLFMTNNILGCYITGLYMTFNQWQFLLSTSPFCCVRHASLQTWLLILSGQKSTGNDLTTHGWPPSGSILSHKLQSLSGAPKSPPHNNKSHPQLIFWPVCCWRIAGRAFFCQIYTIGIQTLVINTLLLWQGCTDFPLPCYHEVRKL